MGINENTGSGRSHDMLPQEVRTGADFESDDDIERIRERTFTPEFVDLVSKVTAHSRAGEMLDSLSGEALLERFHGLFYRSASLVGLDRANTSFNQFDLLEDYPQESLEALIVNGMAAAGAPSFAVMSFDLSRRCFVPVIRRTGGLPDESLVFDIGEPLVKNAFQAKTGVVIDDGLVAGDEFIKKRFRPDKDGVSSWFLLVSVRSLYLDYAVTLRPAPDIDLNGISLLLLVEITSGPSSGEKSALFRKIQRLVMPQLVYYGRVLARRELIKSADDLERAYSLAEYCCCLYGTIYGNEVQAVRCVQADSPEVFFAFGFLYYRLYRHISRSSLVLRLTRDTMIVFTSPGDAVSIGECIDEFKRLYPGSLSVILKEPGKSFTLQRLLAVI